MEYKFEDIAFNISAKRAPVSADKETYIGLEHLDSGSLTISRWGTPADLKGDKLIMTKGDVLFGKRNTYLKRVAIAPFDGLFSAHGMILRPKEDVVDKNFFPFFIYSDTFMSAAIRISVGSLSPTINWKDLKELRFKLPSLEEQKVLAEKLWAAYELKQSYIKMIAATDEMVKSQFIEMFGNPITNEKCWKLSKLSEVGKLARGVSKARPRNAPDLIGGPYPLVQTGEVANCETYITTHESSYSEKGLAQSKMWPQGTLCITIAANIAKTGILTFDACFPDSIVGFIPKKEVNILFVHHWFCTIQKDLERQAPSTAQKNFNLEKLSNLMIIVPPKDHQDSFVSFIQQADKSKFELKQSIAAIDKVIKSLINEII